MSTQGNPKIDKIIRGMMEAGTPRSEAVAIGMAMEHALSCPEYAKEYGTFLAGELQSFVDRVGKQP
jgi:hypothetical protein